MQSSRREFLGAWGRLIVLVPLAGALVACEGDECGGAGAVSSTSTELTVTSECAANHTHDYTIADGDLATPPANGVAGSSTPYEDDGHVHTVTLTMQNLADIEGGQTVTVTSGVTSAHTHTFRFRTSA